MASSDDEGETFPDAISEYCFFDKADDPLPFSKLAVQWNESENSGANAGPIFLDGKVDNGLGKFYQQVKAWKYDITTAIPEISVLSKDNHWIKLKKPRKSYENMIRSILICVHCLCFFKSKPEAPGKSLWDHLLKVFSLYDIRPSENDLIDHIDFLTEAVKRDATLSKSKFLAAFLENPTKRNSFNEDAGTATKPSFIVDDVNGEMQDDDITNQIEDSESDDEDDHFDSVCAICDNGGKITCCEGKCFRSFHATPNSEEAQDSNCESLCFSKELEAHEQYKCENCQYSLHQCFVCGELGSSDKSSNTEVFRCSSATCGHFYHPACVAKLLQKNDTERQTLKEKIAAGEPFTCPAHKCAVCKQTENEKVEDLQFAICRRCPKSYHRKCLPRDIMFDHQVDDDDDDDVEVRAWDGLLAKSRALIYCTEHEIDPELATPARTIIFRNILNRKAEQPQKKKLAVKVAGGNSVDPSKKKSALKSQEGVEAYSVIKRDGSSKKRAAVSSGPESSKKKKVSDASKNLLRSVSTKVKKPSPNDGQPTLGSRLFDVYDMYTGAESTIKKDETVIDDNKRSVAAKSQEMEILPPLDEESKQRIMALMKEAASSVTLDEVKKYHQGKVPSTHAHSSRVDKSIMLSRVEGSVEALNLALKKLEEGCSVEDAMAVCEPGVIDQLLRWKDKLKVYLAPFLHGMRYTSFGRHFTKVEKLEKIVDKLHWYVEDGDTIVDFCCGANDFSCLMKKKLDEMGKKKCSYKNYDIAPPKNDFNFEKRDWMKVSPRELPCSGSQLIMGLNPPFGRNAALANKFVDNALKFKPKLIILIVPPETERLDSSYRTTPYDLVWEDVELLAGKSFYLPGSVDVNDKQMDQWNTIPPPLYLWSRRDFTSKHKSIAQEHGHTPKVEPPPQSDENVTRPGPAIGKNEIEDDLPVVTNGDSKTASKAKTPKNKKRKKESPGGSETKSKQIAGNGKSNQNSSKKTRHNQEPKIEEHDDQVSNRQDLAQKLEEAQAPIKAQKSEKIQAPAEAKKRESAQASVEAKKRELAQTPVEVQKHEKKLDPVESQKHEKTQDTVKVQKHELTRPPSREIKVQKPEATLVPSRELESRKHEKSQAPLREIEDQKHEKTRAISREIEAQKHEKARASPSEIEPQKHEKARVLPHETEAPKHEKARASPHKTEAQKHEKARASPPGTETQKHERARASPHEIEAQKHEKAWASPPGTETQKQGRARAPPREIEAQKHGKARASPHKTETHKHEKAWGPSRESEAQRFESKRPSPQTRDEKVHETLNTDFSFVDVDKPFDEHLNNSAIDESTFSLENDDVGYLVRKYSSVNEEPYMGSKSHRRLDGYSTRPDHLQYPAYDRVVGRGPAVDEISPRAGGAYTMGRHEPVSTRYSTPDATPYNRTSTSATQRYAPRLDELNHVRGNNLGRSEFDEMNHVRMGGMGRLEPPPMGSRSVGAYRPSMNAPGLRMDSLGFAPGPYHSYQHNSSGGWLNE
ncbi:hypothetical protein SSX86_000445 [Deinandra increscens subsp. villosa]|uniref:Zinc finger PHD-type domain-containing protein n=1 Tax=Deinandra increscens subsp. villosa TaxID=3103831 RepID=A0AAP0DXX8_9ASTR